MAYVTLSVRSPLGIQKLETAAAADFELLAAAFKKRWAKDLCPYSGLRLASQQQALYTAYLNYKRDPKHYPYAALALPPGRSTHETGHGCDYHTTVDGGKTSQMLTAAEHTWLVENGPSYGWYWTGEHFTPPESWHFDHPSLSVAGHGTPIVEQQKPKRRTTMYLIRVTSADNSYTEALLTDFVHTKVISAAEARNVMYCRPDLADVDGFDSVVAQSNYDALKALPPFPVTAGSGTSGTADLSPVLAKITTEADRVISKIPTKLAL